MSYNAKRIIKNILSGILAFFISISTIFLMLGVVLNIVYIKTTVRGYSMQPTLNAYVTTNDQDGDVVFINRFREYAVGDIVIADDVTNDHHIIKRLVGLEGDEIQIKEINGYYHLLVNGDLLYTRRRSSVGTHGLTGTLDYYQLYLQYIEFHRGTDKVVTNSSGEECIKVNKNECFLMGDNWGETSDSMSYGTLNVSSIIGKAEFVIPMGENVMINAIKNFWEILT